MELGQAQIGFVAAVGAQGFRVGKARQRKPDVETRDVRHALDQRLDHLEDGLLLREGHLQIDLRKFRLPVGAQVLVAETAHDLKILIEAAHHQQLLEDLRRLRQRVEGARIDARWHQIIAGALGRGAGQDRRFDFEEPLTGKHLADSEGDLRAQDDVALHTRAAQIDVAVFEARVFLDVHVVFHGERGRARFVQYPQLLDHEFDFSGGDSWINVIRRARTDGALGRNDVFGSEQLRLGVQRRVYVFVEDQLGHAFAVAKVNEDDPAQIAAAMYPSHQQRFLACIGGAQFAPVVGAAQVA